MQTIQDLNVCDDLTPGASYTFPHYVVVTRVQRSYGGPEEGGWWYDAHIEAVHAVRVEGKAESDQVAKELTDMYKRSRNRDGNVSYRVFHSFDVPQTQSNPRPHYE